MAAILPVEACWIGERCCMIRAISDKKNERVDSRRIEERRERRLIAFESLFRLVEKLGATFDVGEIANLLVTFMGEQKVKRTSLYLVASRRKRLEPHTMTGAAGGGVLPCIPLESAFVRWLAEADGPVRLDEFNADAGQAAAEDEEDPRSLVEAGFSHGIGLTGREGLLGMLLYGGVDEGDGLHNCDGELCAMLARGASISIGNALLHEEIDASMKDLEKFSGAKRELIANVAQDIRMPLAFLKSALWSLEPDQAGENVLVDMAKDAAGRLERKIEYVLSISDIEPDASGFEMESADVSSIVEDILREKLPELEEKQVHVDLDDRARFRKALIDPGKLAVVIRSLVDNAVHAVERDGTVTVTIRVSEESPGKEDGVDMDDRRANAREEADPRRNRRSRNADASSYLVIDVRDDGIVNLDRLGSGLLISQKVVSGHGGKLLCTSDPGWGAQFSIWIPLDV
ncbi:MAG: HAMP domain-containing sensor histidine kinase [Candidatus Krumholzibacteriia bacterium]